MPFIMITVITINKDNIKGLKKTVNSISTQSYRRYKHIIVDGSSRDGSIEYIKSLTGKGEVTHLYDEGIGIYNAMNMGIKGSSTEYLFFLNSGDIFYNKDSLKLLAKNSGGVDVVHGMYACEGEEKINIDNKQSTEVYFDKRYQHDIPSLASSLLLRKKVLEVKGFSTKYKISSDVELMYKIALSGGTFRCIRSPIVIFDTTGISSTRPIIAIKERFMILLTHKPAYIFCLIFEILGYLGKRITRKLSGL